MVFYHVDASGCGRRPSQALLRTTPTPSVPLETRQQHRKPGCQQGFCGAGVGAMLPTPGPSSSSSSPKDARGWKDEREEGGRGRPPFAKCIPFAVLGGAGWTSVPFGTSMFSDKIRYKFSISDVNSVSDINSVSDVNSVVTFFQLTTVNNQH
jgi:hypothetical protein